LANKYETNVKPNLDKIVKWMGTLSERQIASKLGVSHQSFINYKKQYPELAEAVVKGQQDLRDELYDTLKRKAKGYSYIETKIIEDDKNGKRIETYEKYAQPDTGAIHLLLKNIDPDWHNDDKPTLDLKRKAQELEEKKLEMREWS
jgi:hypothetical protein